MKYILIPILKIITLLIVILLISPFRWVFNLFFHFKLLSIKKTFTIDNEYMFDYTLKYWISDIFSKESTDNFLQD